MMSLDSTCGARTASNPLQAGLLVKIVVLVSRQVGDEEVGSLLGCLSCVILTSLRRRCHFLSPKSDVAEAQKLRLFPEPHRLEAPVLGGVLMSV